MTGAPSQQPAGPAQAADSARAPVGAPAQAAPAVQAAPAGRHVLKAQQVQFAYRPQSPVLRGVDLVAEEGKLVSILGPNGSGKTTLLRCLLGQLKPAGGTIMLDGRELRKHSARGLARLMAYVPQFPQSAFAFTTREIVLMGRFAHTGLMGLASRHDLAVAEQAMAMTDTQAFADRTLDELSGGEAQRVMIARALAQQPSVLLLDEPTSHLDIKNQLAIHGMMQRVAHDWPMAVVCVSHDINLAARFSDELVLMRDGQVVADGPASEVVRADILSQVYDVQIDLISAGDRPVPLIFAR
jgi:ABC-type cobalamin/Fe3+-siderophores transport system ATPase subunit